MGFAQEHSWLGYRSLSNFVTAGARRLLQEARKEAYQKKLLETGVPDKRFLENVSLIEAAESERSRASEPRASAAPGDADGPSSRLPPLPPDALVLKPAGHQGRRN